MARAARRQAAGGLPPVRPQKPRYSPDAPPGRQWIREIKYDGYRGLLRIEGANAEILTRNGYDWTRRFPAVAEAAARLGVQNAILDGELVVERQTGGESFSALVDALATARGQRAIVMRAFDLLWLDGADLRALPLCERKEALRALLARLPAGDAIRYVEHISGEPGRILRAACEMGLEGIVSKRADAPYRGGESEHWIKTKCAVRDSFVVGGYVGTASSVESVLVGWWDRGRLRYAGRVGTGISRNAQATLLGRLIPRHAADCPFASLPEPEEAARWVRPEIVVEVETRGWTGSGRLRQAVFKGVRDDVEAAEIRLDIAPDSPAADGDPPGAAQGRQGRSRESPEAGAPARPRLTNPHRSLWDDAGIDKAAYADYLAMVAPRMLPHVLARPLMLVRCPGGAEEGCFHQRHGMAGLPRAIHAVELPGGEGATLLVADAGGIAAMAQIAALEIHVNGSRVTEPGRPDRLVIDLDPAEDVPWPKVAEAAAVVRDRLAGLGLASFPLATGGKGLHVVVPLQPTVSWTQAKAWTHRFCQEVAREHPRGFTTNMAKRARRGRIFLDYLRNDDSATAIAPWSARARPGAPIAFPLSWREIDAPPVFSILTAERRLRAGDPWAGCFALHQVLPDS
ncbi:DNA ligase D [Arenibaculum pallidiluteum]|uniref:DNA ligase D n=1 Tax=Arenibaculum pallidiluteum TaxID=2812559 RepID=UPI001A977F38|nr:DNA ligase D [Arenibaculum pallidiluteum]